MVLPQVSVVSVEEGSVVMTIEVVVLSSLFDEVAGALKVLVE